MKDATLARAATEALAQATAILLYIKVNHPDVFQDAMNAWEEENGVQPTTN